MLTLDQGIALYIAYLFGSVSSAIIVCKIMRLPDPRTAGSRNPGATNVLRIGGKKAAAFTLLGDILKSILPILCARWYGFDFTMLGYIGFAAFLGHLFPIYFRFEGGKGVATLLGVMIALYWPLSLCWMATWAVIAVLFRYSSLASLIASLLAPLYVWLLLHNQQLVVVFAVMSLLIIIRHRENIYRLWKGKESKLKWKR